MEHKIQILLGMILLLFLVGVLGWLCFTTEKEWEKEKMYLDPIDGEETKIRNQSWYARLSEVEQRIKFDEHKT